jgi:predicted NAD/FAD-dependent oxidoreductase
MREGRRHHHWSYLLLPTAVLQHMAQIVLDPITSHSLKYPQLSQGPTKEKWIHGLANKLGI